jgi:hypothetical protein
MVNKARAARRANEERRRVAAEKQRPLPADEQLKRAAANARSRRDEWWQSQLLKAARLARWTGEPVKVDEHESYPDRRLATVDPDGTVRNRKAEGQ